MRSDFYSPGEETTFHLRHLVHLFPLDPLFQYDQRVTIAGTHVPNYWFYWNGCGAGGRCSGRGHHEFCIACQGFACGYLFFIVTGVKAKSRIRQTITVRVVFLVWIGFGSRQHPSLLFFIATGYDTRGNDCSGKGGDHVGYPGIGTASWSNSLILPFFRYTLKLSP